MHTNKTPQSPLFASPNHGWLSYPFGMEMPGRANSSGNGYKFGFNGKEKETEFNEGVYDFGARIYDGRIGRWMSVDPLASQRAWVSPYNFCQNNPVNRIDPTGALDFKPWYIDQKTGDAKWFITDAQAKGKGLDRLGDDVFFGKKGQTDVDKWKKEGKTESKNISEKEVKEKYDYKKVEKSYKLEQTAQATPIMYYDGNGIVGEVNWNIITEKTNEKSTYTPDNSVPNVKVGPIKIVKDIPTQKIYNADVEIKWDSGNFIEQMYYNNIDYTPKIVPVN